MREKKEFDYTDFEISLLDPSLNMMLTTQGEFYESYTLLNDFDPEYIVLYDPDVYIIRAIESHQSKRAKPIKVYFLMYGKSMDNDRYSRFNTVFT